MDYCLRMVVYHKLTYPLTSTTFTKDQCVEIPKPLLSAGLLAMGIMWNFPRAVICGPYMKQGMQFPNLHMEQTVQQIMTLLAHYNNTDDPIEAQINANCKSLRMEMGWMGNIFDILEACKILITKSWIKKLWKERYKNNILIQSKISDFDVLRRGDCEIVQKIVNCSYKQQELQIINRCRMWLKATFLSDIYNGSGNKIQTNCWEGLDPVNSALEWPCMENPTPVEWMVWQRALTAVLHLNKHHKTTLKLGDRIVHNEPALGWYLELNTPRLYKWDR